MCIRDRPSAVPALEVGGAQGILDVGRPNFGSFTFVTPQHYYYLILAGCMLALFIAWRLRDGRAGRQWMAVREDEDVAEAVGINLVGTKLLAFAIGAGFAGLAGAIFGSRVGSVFPNSFELLISINVLAIIIVGGVQLAPPHGAGPQPLRPHQHHDDEQDPVDEQLEAVGEDGANARTEDGPRQPGEALSLIHI